MLKLASILIGIICGYIVSLFFGMVDFSAIGRAAVIAVSIKPGAMALARMPRGPIS